MAKGTTPSKSTPPVTASAVADFEDFDEDAFAGLREESSEQAQELATSGGGGDFNTLFFVGEGKYTLRLWPEVIVEDGRRKLRIVRIMRTHNIPNVGRIPCEGENCRFCAETKKLYDIKFKDAFKTAGKDEGVVTGYIFETSVKDSKYIKPNVPAYMVIRKKMLIAFQQWISELDNEDLRRVFNPKNEALGIVMTLTGGNKGNASIGFAPKEYELPELPETFEAGGMGRVFYDEHDPEYGTDEDLNKYRRFVAEIVAGRMNLSDPKEDEGKKASPARPDKAAAKKAAADTVTEALGKDAGAKKPAEKPAGKSAIQAAKEAAEAAKAGAKPEPKAQPVAGPAPIKKGLPECPGKEKDDTLDFGKYDAENVECIVCEHENVCQRYAAKLAKATA